MKLGLPALILLLLTPCFAGDVSYINVSNENSYSSVSDFANTFEININQHGKTQITKCQAVRLDRNWFITAAHCISPACDDTCSIQARLLINKNYEMDLTATHTKKQPIIFTCPKSNVEEKNAAYDVALIHFKPSLSKIIYKNNEKGQSATEEEFIQQLPNYNMFTSAYYGRNIPPMLSVEAKEDSIIKKSISIASIWDGKRGVLKSTRPIFYSPKMHYIHTENFGVIQGISGSGAMTNTGELIGIVSALAELDYIDRDSKQKIHTNIIFIASFDQTVIDFIKQYLPTLTFKKDDNTLMPIPDAYKKSVSGIGEAADQARQNAVDKSKTKPDAAAKSKAQNKDTKEALPAANKPQKSPLKQQGAKDKVLITESNPQ